MRKIFQKQALLVEVYFDDIHSAQESLDELAFLAKTAKVKVMDKIMQKRSSIDNAYYVGKGKLEEIQEIIEEKKLDMVIFDNELKPVQIRNLEKVLKCLVLDRTELILHIFAIRARTKQAKFQVQSAQLKYELPRLRGMWTHFSKVEGGIGVRGMGEKQIEVDRRLIQRRIKIIDKKLKEIEKRRVVGRKAREKSYKVSLVGYTNAGKSTLLNILSGSNVFAENKLFATLDSTTRRVDLGNNNHYLLSDTVGFIKKLPHNLIASFHATLDEINYTDLILHVIDISHPNYKDHICVVEETLKEIGCEDKEIMMVFNKGDLLDNLNETIERLNNKYGHGKFFVISAKTGLGISRLNSSIISHILGGKVKSEIEIELSNGKALSFLRANSTIIDEKRTDKSFIFHVYAEESIIKKISILTKYS